METAHNSLESFVLAAIALALVFALSGCGSPDYSYNGNGECVVVGQMCYETPKQMALVEDDISELDAVQIFETSRRTYYEKVQKAQAWRQARSKYENLKEDNGLTAAQR